MENAKENLSFQKVDEMEPDFSQLYNTFREQVCLSRELTNRVFVLSDRLKPVKRQDPESPQKPNNPEGIIQHLWDEVYKLASINKDLNVVANHLQSIIGL